MYVVWLIDKFIHFSYQIIHIVQKMLTLTDSTANWLKKTANHLKGSVRRIFMAEVVQELGYGGATAAEEKQGNNPKRGKRA